MIQPIKCYSCVDGYLPTMIPRKLIKCIDCGGTGKLLVDPQWKEDGEYLRHIRINHFKEGLRSFCMNRGLDAGEVSKIERGISPAPENWEKHYGTTWYT